LVKCGSVFDKRVNGEAIRKGVLAKRGGRKGGRPWKTDFIGSLVGVGESGGGSGPLWNALGVQKWELGPHLELLIRQNAKNEEDRGDLSYPGLYLGGSEYGLWPHRPSRDAGYASLKAPETWFVQNVRIFCKEMGL